MSIQRHDIVLKLGPKDRKGIAARAEWRRVLLDFYPTEQLLHGVGSTIDGMGELGLKPTQIGIDLALLGAGVYAADTRIERAEHSQDGWTRELALRVPVSDPKLWETQRELLVTMLEFLTGDKWEIHFRSRPAALANIAPEKLKKRTLPKDVRTASLFSGGLDSLIGAIDLLADGSSALFVSHAADGATSSSQNDCFGMVGDAFKDLAPQRLRAWVQFDHDLFEGDSDEKTMRGRSFLFLALGVLAGTGLGKSFSLRIPENGFISLNVPLEPTRVGALSTRTTHPFYLARWRELLAGLGFEVELQNPYQFDTKGGMVKSCKNQEILRKALPLSMSCSSPAKARWLGLSSRHCGYCVPCLIRRAAVQAAWGKDPTTYTVDVTKKTLDPEKAEGTDVHAFQYALWHLGRSPGAARVFVRKSGPLTDCEGDVEKLAGVFERGLREVGKLVGPLK